MKVLIITTLYPGNPDDTARKVSYAVHNLVKELPSQGIEVKKIIKPETLVEWKKLRLNSVFTCSEIDGLEIETKSFFNLPISGVLPVGRDLEYLERNLQEVDLVVAHMTRSIVIAHKIFEKFRVPFLCVLHASDLSWCRKLKPVLQKARGVYARSPSIKRRAEALGIRIDGVVFSGVDSAFISENKSFKYTKGGVLRLVTVSNLQSLKNIDVVLESLALLPSHIKWRYTIIGDGAEYENIRQNIDRLGLSDDVVMLGHKDHADCLKAMKNSDVFVMPSAPETFGLVYLEAMASGCIVIGSNGWGIDGIVKNNENGYLVEPRSVSDLLRTIESIFEQPQAHILSNSMQTIKEFTTDKAIKNYAKCIINSHQDIR